MIIKYFHLGLRQVVMALMNWAIDVPQKLLQSDAKLFLKIELNKIIERLIIQLILIFLLKKVKFRK